MTIDQFPYTARYFGGIDTRVEAIGTDPDVYHFDRWQTAAADTASTDVVTSFDISGGDTIIAHFATLISGTKDFDAEGYAFTVQPTLTSGNTSVHFALPEADGVKVQLYDMLGQPVRMLLQSGNLQSGPYKLDVDLRAAGIPAGAYIINIRTEKGYMKSDRIVLQ
jgi:hypothetical protein